MRTASDRDRALEGLVASHGDHLFTIGYRMCGNRSDAEDLVQETFLSAWRGWSSFRGQADPRTWLYTIASRACQRKRRLRSGEPRRFLPLEEVLPRPDPAAVAPDLQADRRRTRERVRRAVLDLPPPYRMALVLRDIEELPLTQISKVLDLPLPTVKTRIHRGRLALRKSLLREPPPPAGSVPPRTCLAALERALDGMDRGGPPRAGHACAACRRVYRSLALGRAACRALAGERLSEPARRRILETLGGRRKAESSPSRRPNRRASPSDRASDRATGARTGREGPTARTPR
jgi:RNA polymerase sigma-70 factor (ECF subfamily)